MTRDYFQCLRGYNEMGATRILFFIVVSHFQSDLVRVQAHFQSGRLTLYRIGNEG